MIKPAYSFLISRQGAGCNVVDETNDAPNYLTLLQELRAALDSNFGAGTKEITLAVRVQPFDVSGGFVTDMSAYAKVVTRFNIMAYGKLTDFSSNFWLETIMH